MSAAFTNVSDAGVVSTMTSELVEHMTPRPAIECVATAIAPTYIMLEAVCIREDTLQR